MCGIISLSYVYNLLSNTFIKLNVTLKIRFCFYFIDKTVFFSNCICNFIKYATSKINGSIGCPPKY